MGNKIKRAIGVGDASISVFPVPVKTTRAPTATDIDYPLGQLWVRVDTAQAWTLCKLASGAATWALASPGASDVDTINSLAPVGGDILIAGGTNLAVANAGHTVTLNMDAAITLATSVTSPLFTSAAAMAITVAAGSDITVKMGDAAGAKKISYTDSAAAERASLDSNGKFTAVNLVGILGASGAAAVTGTTITGTSMVSPIYTVGAGVDLNINAVAGQNIIIKMGDNAGAKKVSFTDSDDAEVAKIDSNGAFTTTGLTFTGLLTASASATINTAGTTLNLATDNDAAAVLLGVGTTPRAIGIGSTGGVAHTVTIGSASAGAIAVDSAANISLDAATDSNFTSSAASATAITIEASNGAGGVTIKAGSAGILIGNEADTAILSLGDFAPTASRTITIGGGTVVTAAVTDTIDIGPDGATTNANSIKTVNINTGGVTTGEVLTNIASGTVTSGTHTTSIASGNRVAGTMVLNLMTGTGTKTVNLGNADGLTTFNIDGITLINDSINVATSINTGSSSGAVTIGNNSAGVITIDSGAAININSAAAAISIGSAADDFAINVGTGGERTITIGNSTAATALVFTAGSTGDITFNGTVKEIDAEFLFTSGTDLTITQSPMLQSNADTGVAPTGATGDINLMYLQDGALMEQFILGAGQTIIAPRMTANGLNIALDQTVDEGAEYNFGAARNNSKHAFTSQTSLAFFIEAEIYVGTLAGCEPLWVGFRKVQANDADYTNYTDYYVIGLNNATSATNVTVGGRINSGGLTLTDTTDAWGGDASSQTVKVLVSSAGVITAEVGGVAVSTPLAQTFDSGDIIVPFIHFLHDTGTAGEVGLISFKCGFQA